VVIGLAASAGLGQRPNQPSTPQSAVERGKYLVTIMDCHGCHTPFKNGQPDMTRMLSGHPQDVKISAAPPTPAGWGMVVAGTNTAWSGPWGVSFTTNLTPDATGIGMWAEEMFVNAIRKGKHMGAAVNQLGRPSTEALHVIERFRRKDFGHMDIQITIDDPKAYTKPWTLTQDVHLRPDIELMEFICNEKKRDVEHLPGK